MKLDTLLVVLLYVPLGVSRLKIIISAYFGLPDWLNEVLHGFEESKTIVALSNHVVMRKFGKVSLNHFYEGPLVGLHQSVKDFQSFQY